MATLFAAVVAAVVALRRSAPDVVATITASVETSLRLARQDVERLEGLLVSARADVGRLGAELNHMRLERAAERSELARMVARIKVLEAANAGREPERHDDPHPPVE